MNFDNIIDRLQKVKTNIGIEVKEFLEVSNRMEVLAAEFKQMDNTLLAMQENLNLLRGLQKAQNESVKE